MIHLFNSEEFKNGKDKEKREMIGNIIYDYIHVRAGEDKAPKICGMIINLDLAIL